MSADFLAGTLLNIESNYESSVWSYGKEGPFYPPSVAKLPRTRSTENRKPFAALKGRSCTQEPKPCSRWPLFRPARREYLHRSSLACRGSLRPQHALFWLSAST